jgi:hypothetical protein
MGIINAINKLMLRIICYILILAHSVLRKYSITTISIK